MTVTVLILQKETRRKLPKIYKVEECYEQYERNYEICP